MDSTSIAVLALALVGTGAFSGFLAGLLGVGGGIVIVPTLFLVFDAFNVDPSIRMQVAVGTSLATIIPTSIMSARSHERKGAIDHALLRTMAPPVFVGVVIGTVLAGIVSGHVLTAVFATVALIVALNMGIGAGAFAIAHKLPGKAGIGALGAVIGAVSAMMGIGGGTLTVPTLSLFSYPIHRAVGTASLLGLIISVPGAIGFMITGWGQPLLPPFCIGYVNWVGFLLIVPTSMLTAPLGAKTAHAISRQALSRAFALFLAITSVKLFLSLMR
ncbi:MAG: sulfite exporter TauE/SafE family protein [Gemmatimonas sp.]